MENTRYFYSTISEDWARPIDDLLEEMQEQGLENLSVWETKREVGSDFFFCTLLKEPFEKADDVCGKKNCDDYLPRNGKSGCCKHRGFLYGPGGQDFILTLDGKLTQVLADVTKSVCEMCGEEKELQSDNLCKECYDSLPS